MTDSALFSRYRTIIDGWDDFLEALDRPLPTCVWANPLKATPRELEELFRKENILFEPLTWRAGAYRLIDTPQPGSRLAYLAGLYQTQEEVSMLPVELMDLCPGQRVLDMCAAPGSKTTQIATVLGARGTVIANDRNFRRMAPLGRSLDRMGISNTSIMTADAANLPRSVGTFDRVLADVPCSCEGTSRKSTRPSEATESDFHRLCGVQRAILKRGLELCRPGGRVVYSTCTYAPEENEAIVDEILQEFGEDFSLLPARIEGFPEAPGLLEWRGQRFDPRMKNTLRVYPHHHDTGGFFVAIFQRNVQ